MGSSLLLPELSRLRLLEPGLRFITTFLRAIELDPEFGNPYNDIGVCLMPRDKLDESIPWLEKAKQAKRYEPRQFPFMNLGQIYLRQGRWWGGPS